MRFSRGQMHKKVISQKLSHWGFTFHVCTAYNIAIIKTGNAANAPLGTNRCKGGRLAD